jgi:hypothetical protein
MSALGQERTCAVQKGMSALPPIADMCGAMSAKCQKRTYAFPRTGLQWRKSVAQRNIRNHHQTGKRLVQF